MGDEVVDHDDDLDKPLWRDPFWLVLLGYAGILFVLMLLVWSVGR